LLVRPPYRTLRGQTQLIEQASDRGFAELHPEGGWLAILDGDANKERIDKSKFPGG
jgi:hypothetical protein